MQPPFVHAATADQVAGAPVPSCVAAVHIPRHAERFLPVLQCLDRLGLPTVVGVDDRGRLAGLPLTGQHVIETWSGAGLINDVRRQWNGNVLAISDAVILPDDVLARALELIEADVRVATISFLSNDAGFLSFPHRNRPIERPPDGHDATSVTSRLRIGPNTRTPVPTPVAVGGAVLISSPALATLGDLVSPPSGDLAAAIAEFSARCRERGLLNVFDPGTFVSRPSDVSIQAPVERAVTGLTLEDNGWLHERHPTIHPLTHEEAHAPESALGIGLRSARSKLLGLRVLVDGSCLGPQEMGTQVATTALVGALAACDDVQEVCVTLPGPVPVYAKEVFNHPKLRPHEVAAGDLGSLGRYDIAHRPFQPNVGFEVTRWRAIADRVFVSILDLISYQIGTYSGTADQWLAYRSCIRRVSGEVDGLIVISQDVADQVRLEQLPIEDSRVFVATIGAEHLSGDEPGSPPEELVSRGFTGAEFILCLGTNYSHKNRDLAVQACVELRHRGWQGALVMAGPSVPWGSSRVAEALAVGRAAQPREQLVVVSLPDLPSVERNWLLRHAALVLYPTSAEGFGLVPFEAARFGTPTVFVGFGPLAELAGDPPVMAKDWSPAALADAAVKLLQDKTLAARQVEACLKAATNHTWAQAAYELTQAYRSILDRPAR